MKARSDAHLLSRTLVSEVSDELEVSTATLWRAAAALWRAAAVAAVLLTGAVARGRQLWVATEAAGSGGAGLARELVTAIEADVPG
eukprot:scaffold41448_cov67-Phaeocystis_antarctica.AAC.7